MATGKVYVRGTDTIGGWVVKNNDLINNVGDVTLMQTSGADSDIVQGINSLDSDMGNRASVGTGTKTSLVHAIGIGSLNTADSSNLISAINEIEARTGSLDTLGTLNKLTLVAAINEIHDSLNEINSYVHPYGDSDLRISKMDAGSSSIIIADSSVTIHGNLKILGTTFENERFNDQYVTVLSGTVGPPTQDGGLEIERGDSTDARITWNESLDRWTAGTVSLEKVIALETVASAGVLAGLGNYVRDSSGAAGKLAGLGNYVRDSAGAAGKLAALGNYVRDSSGAAATALGGNLALKDLTSATALANLLDTVEIRNSAGNLIKTLVAY